MIWSELMHAVCYFFTMRYVGTRYVQQVYHPRVVTIVPSIPARVGWWPRKGENCKLPFACPFSSSSNRTLQIIKPARFFVSNAPKRPLPKVRCCDAKEGKIRPALRTAGHGKGTGQGKEKAKG